MKKALNTTQHCAQQDGGRGDDDDGDGEEDKFKWKPQRGRNDEEMAENGMSEAGCGEKSSFHEQCTGSLSASSLGK